MLPIGFRLTTTHIQLFRDTLQRPSKNLFVTGSCQFKMELMILLHNLLLKNHNNLMEEQRNRTAVLPAENSASDSIPSFLLKTYQILENDKYMEIISWTRSGQGFIVKKVKEFSESVLPIYFRHSNYTSFVRQLNMYDFHKTRQENHENAFKNVMFKRGFKHLLKDIQRKDYKKNKDSKEAAADRTHSLEKAKEYSKIDRSYQLCNDASKTSLNKLTHLNFALEKKALALAQLREIPTQNTQILQLLDILLDAKKIHKELIEKLQILNIECKQSQARKLTKPPSMQVSNEKECPTTAPKASLFQYAKQERQISTNCFLSFNHI